MINFSVIAGILLPFIGTMLGAVSIMITDRLIRPRLLQSLNAMAAGVMAAAAIFSLLIPSIELTPAIPWLPPVAGFLLGGLSITILEKLLIKQSKRKDGSMLMLAVTLHNFPEGMAVGVALAGLYHAQAISACSAMMLSLGIAIQNIPEGAIIYAPLFARGDSRKRSFLCSLLSGVVEIMGAVLAFLFTGFLSPLLPYILAFAAGAMIFVVADEMIPQARQSADSSVSTWLFMAGFSAMMLLDVAFA